MSADRLLSALLLLRTHGRVTERELADGLKVSERTARRDIEALSAAGVPVFAGHEAEDVWQLDENWRIQIPELDEAELRALLRAQADGQLFTDAENVVGAIAPAQSASAPEQGTTSRQALRRSYRLARHDGGPLDAADRTRCRLARSQAGVRVLARGR